MVFDWVSRFFSDQDGRPRIFSYRRDLIFHLRRVFMAISNADRCFILLHSRQTISRRKTPTPCSPFLLIPSGKRHFLTCSSLSLLENASNELKTVEVEPVFPQLNPQASNSKKFNKFLRNLCKDDRKNDALALDYYKKAKTEFNFRPDQSTLKILIKQILRSKQWNFVSELSEDFVTFSVFPDALTCSRLLGTCIKARKFKTAEKLLSVLEKNDQVAIQAFDSTMKSYNKLHMYSTTISVYEKMISAGVLLDSGCYCRIIEAYRKTGQTDRALSVFLEFKGRKMDLEPSQILIYYNLCESLGKAGRNSEALEFFREMICLGFEPNSSFYTCLICSLASFKDVQKAENLFEEARDKGFIRDPVVFLKLVLMYVEEGLLEKTLEIVKTMKEMKIGVSDCVLCAVVNGYAKKRGLRATIKVYEELLEAGCTPGQVTYASIINVYCRLGHLSRAELVFTEMQDKGYFKCVVAYASMISMYGKVGRLKDAMRLVAVMKQRGCSPNVWVYNSLMDMHGRAMNLKQVGKIWKEMKRRKVEPDRVSYTSIIYAYSKAREFDECMTFYQEFRMNGGKIDRILGGIMVGVFSKSSRIDELIKLLQCLKSDGIGFDARLHRSAINALRDAGLQVHMKWFIESFGSSEMYTG